MFAGGGCVKTVLVKKIALGCGVTTTIFVLIELVLLVFGVVPLSKRTDPYVGFSGYAPLFVKSTSISGEPIFETAPSKVEWFNMQRFPARKDKGVTRIFCIGGSTTYGRPYDDRTSFCGWLRVFLSAVDPNRRWEVINAGGISYASYRAAELMEELAEYEPDLFIVYSGHNEFLEKRTYDRLLRTPEIVLKLGTLASRLRLYSAFYYVTIGQPKHKQDDLLPTEVKTLLDRSVGPEKYHRDDLMSAAVINQYRNSLLRMTRISERADSQLIFVTPASNIGNFSPFKTEPSTGMSASDIEKVASLKIAVTAALEKDDHVRALALAQEALTLDARDADLLYLQGRAFRALGQIDKARKAFINARDEDVCPLRALTPVRQIVTEVSRKNNTGHVDFVSLVNELSPDGIPGSELFLDHVHPTIEGNRQLALALIEEMVSEGILSPAETWNATAITEISEKLNASLDEQAHAVALRNLSKVLGWAGKYKEAEQLVDRAAATIPKDSEIHLQKGSLLRQEGDKKGALTEFREAVRLAPWDPRAHRSLGLMLSELGHLTEARTELAAAIRLDPKLVDAYYDMGIVLQSLGQGRQAEAYYKKTLDLDPGHADAHNNLGVVFAQRGNITAAFEQFSEAVRLDPNHKGATENLAQIRQLQN
jgi:tetratricopeptide (TPR) repeat protein